MTHTAAQLEESDLEIRRHPLRREQRIERVVRVEVCGFNRHGRFFTERTVTANVSDNGCQLHLRIEVEKNSVVALRAIGHRHGREIDTRPVLFQVARIEPKANGWTLGIAKLQPVPVRFLESSGEFPAAIS